MANQLRIIKHDGTSHIVPLGTLKNHHRLNAHLPANLRSRFEEIDNQGNVVKVHAEGSRAEAIAGQNENALLRAEIAKLKEKIADSEKEPEEVVMEKIDAATTIEEVQALSLPDKRPAVMKAAAKKIKSFPKQ